MVFPKYMKYQQLVVSFVIITSSFVTILPASILPLLNSERSFQDDNLFDKNPKDITLEVPKLMTNRFYTTPHSNNLTIENNSKKSDSSIIDTSEPNFAIRSQSGVGGGSYTVNDFLNITNTENLDLTNTASSPDPRDDEFTITIPTGFTNNTGWFNITNIVPQYDWRHVEYDREGDFNIDSNNGLYETIEVAMEFSFPEDYVNLTQIMAFTIAHQSGSFEDPTGKIFIVNGTWETDHWEPNSNDILSSQEDISLFTGWRVYTFDEPVTLRGDYHYFVLLNDTSTTGAWWEWGAQKDSGVSNSDNDNEGEFFYKYQTHGDTWNQGTGMYALDNNLIIKVKPVEKVGTDFNDKTFNQPTELALKYNTTVDETNISQFTWFEWNGTADNTHRFTVNTSITFDVQWVVNLAHSNNPLSASSSYFTQNNSLVRWYLAFSTSSITTSYNIRNRTLLVQNLLDDWN
ncbi:MAG: hypothetical protein ACXADY_18805, partial [Candidatus Hodarchaeales archaeon]